VEKIPNTDTDIAIFWNTNTEYRTDFKNTEKPIPTLNTDTDPYCLDLMVKRDREDGSKILQVCPTIVWRP